MFMQWVYDTLLSLRLTDSPESRTVRTTKGFSVISKRRPVGAGTGMVYRGEYDQFKSYSVGDVVRKRQATPTPIMGVFVCVKKNPLFPPGDPEGVSIAPVFPEPAETGGTNTWEILALGIIQTGACKNGITKLSYANLFQIN
jgi:hypothetical protein